MNKYTKDLKFTAFLLILWLIALICIIWGLTSLASADVEPIQAITPESILPSESPYKQSVERTNHNLPDILVVELLPITDYEVILIAKVVHAAAKGESDFSRMLVAKTMLNRRGTGGYFGDTIEKVVFKSGAFYETGTDDFKNNIYDSKDIDAVMSALDEWGYSDVVYFCNPKTSTNKYMVNYMKDNLVVEEGRMIFAREGGK